MTPEQKVVSLETAKKLQGAGMPPGSEWSWLVVDGKAKLVVSNWGMIGSPRFEMVYGKDYEQADYYPAPDATEIGDELPDKIQYDQEGYHGAYLCFDKRSASYRNSNGHIIVRDDIGEVYFIGDNEAEARAACWLWLKEQKLI